MSCACMHACMDGPEEEGGKEGRMREVHKEGEREGGRLEREIICEPISTTGRTEGVQSIHSFMGQF